MATAIHCDNPHCNTWAFTPDDHWLRVTYINDHSEMHHFCGWDCATRYANSHKEDNQ